MKSNTYLAFNGNCADAFKFYEKVLDGQIQMLIPYADAPPGTPVPPDMGSKIMHARMNFGDNTLMGGDAPAQFAVIPQGFSVNLNIETAEDADRIYSALSEGGAIKMPIGETFWALRFAMFIDKFSVPWMINCERPAG